MNTLSFQIDDGEPHSVGIPSRYPLQFSKNRGCVPSQTSIITDQRSIFQVANAANLFFSIEQSLSGEDRKVKLLSLNKNESKFEEFCESESIFDPEINQIMQIDIFKKE